MPIYVALHKNAGYTSPRGRLEGRPHPPLYSSILLKGAASPAAPFFCLNIEGNIVTRLYFMKLRRITQNALDKGEITSELERERAKLTPTFTHYLDIPMVFLIIALGVLKPTT